MGLIGNSSYIFAKIAGNNNIYSEWSDQVYGMNNKIPYQVIQNEFITFSLVLDLSETGERTDVYNKTYTGYKLSLYINGEEEKNSYLNIEQWEKFKETYMDKTNTLDIGMYRNTFDLSDGKKDDAYKYGGMSLKNLRFYTRPLSDEEIKLNYDTRLAYDEDNN